MLNKYNKFKQIKTNLRKFKIHSTLVYPTYSVSTLGLSDYEGVEITE